MDNCITSASSEAFVSEHNSLSHLLLDYSTTQEKALSEGVNFIGLDEDDVANSYDNDLYLSVGSPDKGLLSILKVKVSDFGSKSIKIAKICYVSTAYEYRSCGFATRIYLYLAELCIYREWILARGNPSPTTDIEGYRKRLHWLKLIDNLVVVGPDDVILFDIAQSDYIHEVETLNISDWSRIISNYRLYKRDSSLDEVSAHRSLAAANLRC